jgi:hypothetical protein
MFFEHTYQTNLYKYNIKLLRIEFILIIKPRRSFQLAKTIKPLIKILEILTCKKELKFAELFLDALFVTVRGFVECGTSALFTYHPLP